MTDCHQQNKLAAGSFFINVRGSENSNVFFIELFEVCNVGRRWLYRRQDLCKIVDKNDGSRAHADAQVGEMRPVLELFVRTSTNACQKHHEKIEDVYR